MPRTQVNTDSIFGEDRISKFEDAKQKLKWTPQYSMEEIISSMWNIYNK